MAETLSLGLLATLSRKTWYILRHWPVIPLLIAFTLLVVGIFAPLLAPHDPIRPDFDRVLKPPAWYAEGEQDMPLGSDQLGRDILSRMLYGARITLWVAGFSLVSGMVVGVALGLVAGYYGGLLDEVIMRVVDVWYGLPYILIALVAVIVLGQKFYILLLLLALISWSAFVRIVRAEALRLKTLDYVALARVAGASTPRILIRHILPGTFNLIMVVASLRVGQLILTEATLSFLGVGIAPPNPAWGAMIANGREYLATAWWVSTMPGLCLFTVVMGLNFLGDWLRDRFDPRLRQL